MGIHTLVGVLVLIAAFTRVDDDQPQWPVWAAAVIFTLIYAAGSTHRVREHPQLAYVWGAGLTVAWAALVLTTPNAVWLAFPLFFLAMHVLPMRIALPVVVLLTGVAVWGFAWQQGTWTVGGILGPTLGAAVAIGVVLGVGVLSEQSQRQGVLEERDRLAREVHDTLAQGLGSIHLLLGAAQAQLEPRPQEAARLIAQARTTAAENLAEARSFVRALAPPDLAERSLPDALAQLTSRIHTPQASLTISGEPSPLPGSVEVALLRIAQEALANTVQHAEASRVGVTLSYMDDEVALDVVDDGIGISAQGGGFGMTSMRQRASELGGILNVESTAGQGAAVAVTIPVARA